MNGFQSGFADKIIEMLEFRYAIGYNPESHTAYLLKFDAFCREHYTRATELIEAIVLTCVATEQGGTVSANQAIRAFGNYLQVMGEDAYVLPDGFSSSKRTFNAYVFTDSELSALLREISRVKPTETSPYIDIVAPVLFRLTYTSGLRPNESRELPLHYGKRSGVYTRFGKWRDDGVLEAVFRALSAEADMENLGIDAAVVKVHQSANDREKGTKPQQ